MLFQGQEFLDSLAKPIPLKTLVRLAAFYDRGADADPDDGKIDVAPNAGTALELYRLAAQSDIPIAMYNVGVFYETGRSVDRDLNLLAIPQ